MKAQSAAHAAHAAGSCINRFTRACVHTRKEGNGKTCGMCGMCGKSPLLDLALRVARLGPDRRNPERFHEDKSEIVAELRRLARKKDAGR